MVQDQDHDGEGLAELQDAAVAAAEDNAEWWTGEWLKFPTISLDEEGGWHYWDVPADSGVYSEDWRIGEGFARDTVKQMQGAQQQAQPGGPGQRGGTPPAPFY